MRIFLLAVCMLALAVPAAWSRDVRVTVYNSDVGVVKDTRLTQLQRGLNHISMDEIASRIDPTSVKLHIEGGGEAEVMEQNFEYDLISPDKLLGKYLEQEIEITTEDGTRYQGTLIGFDGVNLVLSLAGDQTALVSRDKVTDVVLPPLETGLIVKPTLFWTVESRVSGQVELEVAYITQGMKWHAEYLATIGQQDDHLEMASWVSVDNRSGATYPDARLKLIAGDIHRVEEQAIPRPVPRMEADMAMAPRLEEKAFFEYHMYTLEGATTLRDNEVKQIQLFPERQVKARKEYNFDSLKGDGVRVVMRFENSQAAGLGIPLPRGKVRVFKADADGSLEFLGEDLIDHTPRDEEVKIYVGDAFDLVVDRKRTEYNKISDRTIEETFEIEISNHKEEDVQVTVTEHLYGDWDIRRTSHDYRKIKAGEIEFEVPVEARGEAVLTYTVRRKV